MGDSAKGEAYSWQNSPGGIYNHFAFFYTCRKISFSITFSFNPFCVKPGCSAHQTRLVTKKLCTGIFYRKH